MGQMRRALLATLLCAAPLLSTPAYASQDLLAREALRAAVRLEPRASARGGVVPLPLPERAGARAAAADAGELARIARSAGATRVLVGVRSHADLRGVARVLERLGAEPEAFRPIGVLAATVPSGAALARALGGDARVAYIERDGWLM